MPSIDFTDKEVKVLGVMISRMMKQVEWVVVTEEAQCTNKKQAENVWGACRKKIKASGGNIEMSAKTTKKTTPGKNKRKLDDADETPSKKNKTQKAVTPLASDDDDEEDEKKPMVKGEVKPEPDSGDEY